jgi:hypothetical protein
MGCFPQSEGQAARAFLNGTLSRQKHILPLNLKLRFAFPFLAILVPLCFYQRCCEEIQIKLYHTSSYLFCPTLWLFGFILLFCLPYVFWCFGVLVFWCFGVLVFWCFGVLVFWCFGVLVFWCFGVLVFWLKTKKPTQKWIGSQTL